MAINPSVNPEQDAAKSATPTVYPLDEPRRVSTPFHRARRQILKGALGTLAVGALGWLGWIKVLFPPGTRPPQAKTTPDAARVKLGALANFASGGPPQIVSIEDKATGDIASYVVAKTDGDFRVLSAKCTHQGCVVGWSPKERALLCPCHGAKFGADGAVLQGPAKLPLPVVQTHVENGALFVEG